MVGPQSGRRGWMYLFLLFFLMLVKYSTSQAGQLLRLVGGDGYIRLVGWGWIYKTGGWGWIYKTVEGAKMKVREVIHVLAIMC